MRRGSPRYTESFKRSLVNLYHNGKTQTQLCEEFGVSPSALGKWVKRFSDVSDNHHASVRQVEDQQRLIARLEEENLILRKAFAIFAPQCVFLQKA